MIELPTVDLVAMDGIGGRLSKALAKTLSEVRFRRVLVWSPEWSGIGTLPSPSGETPALLHEWRSDYEGWNRFMVRELWKFIPDGHCLFIHEDGYVLNGAAWTDEFLEYDYLGAPWWYGDRFNVGNGGFSLRSKKYLEASNVVGKDWPCYAPEDHLLIRVHGAEMEAQGVRFGPENLAGRFSREGGWGGGYQGGFGFHGFGTPNLPED
jgi:hypothetical protein